MKKSIFMAFMAATFSISAFASDVWSDGNATITYDSATTMGDSVVVVNPRITFGNYQALIFAGRSDDGSDEGSKVDTDYGSGFCKAMGYKSGKISSDMYYPGSSTLLAVFDNEGSLVEVITGSDDEDGMGVDLPQAIKIVTCKK